MNNTEEYIPIDKKSTKQVRINAELHRELKIKAATEKTSVKTLIERAMTSYLSPKGSS